MVDGLRICLEAKRDHNRETNEKNDCLATSIEDQDLPQNKSSGMLWIETHRFNEKMKEFKVEIVEKVREDMQKNEEKMFKKLKEK